MANEVRHTLIFLAGQYTWSETYVDVEDSPPINSHTVSRARSLATARSYLLGVGCAIQAVRVSIRGVKRDTYPVINDGSKDGMWLGPKGIFTTSASGANMDFTPTCLRVRYDVNGNNFSIRYHAGMPDAVFSGPRAYDLSQLDGGMASWKKWTDRIIDNGWGMMGATGYAKAVNTPVTAIANNGTGRLLITCGAAFAVGSKFILSGAQFSLGDKVNGTYTVASIAGGVITTIEATPLIAGSVYIGGGNVRQYSFGGNEFVEATPLGVSEHKRGARGFFSPRGRQSRRKLQHA